MKGRKILLAGVITLLAGLILRFIGIVTPSLVVFLAGIAGCIAGVIVGTVNVIRVWWSSRPARPTRAVHKRHAPRKKKSFSVGKLIFWISFLLFIVMCATRTEETGAAAISKNISNTMFTYIALIGMCLGGAAWGAKRQKEDPKYQEQERQFRELEQRLHTERELAMAVSEVKLIGGSTEFKRGGLKGAMVGCLLGGGIGAVLGAVTRNGKAVHKQRFAVKYANGRTGTEEHEVGSQRYNELMRYVKWEDI